MFKISSFCYGWTFQLVCVYSGQMRRNIIVRDKRCENENNMERIYDENQKIDWIVISKFIPF